MRHYLRTAAAASGAIGALAVLMFPERFGERLSTLVAYGALVISVALLHRARSLQFLMLWFSVAVVVALQRAAGSPSSVSHFTNLALGLMVFGFLAGWRWKTGHGKYSIAVVCAITTSLVFAGILLTDWSRAILVPGRMSGLDPTVVGTYLPGLSAGGANRNVVGGLAAALVPLAVATALTRNLGPWRFALASMALIAGTLGVLLSQSSSVIASSAVSACVSVALVVPRRWRWLPGMLVVIVLMGAALVAFRPVHWLAASDNLLPRAKTEGAILEPLRSRSASEPEIRRLTEVSGGGRHGLVIPLTGAPGLYRFSIRAKAQERTVIRVHSDTISAVVDLETGRYNDYGLEQVVVRPIDEWWTQVDVVAPLSESLTYLGIDVKDHFVEWGRNHAEGHQAAFGAGLLIVSIEANRLGGVWDRVIGMASVMRGRAVGSLESRTQGWHAAFNLLRDSPWLGIGLNTFRYQYQPPIRPYSGIQFEFAHAHNQWIQSMLDVGLFGLIPLLALHGAAAHALWKGLRVSRRAEGPASGLAGAALALLLFGVFDAIALGAKVGIVWWMVWGAMFTLASPDRRPLV